MTGDAKAWQQGPEVRPNVAGPHESTAAFDNDDELIDPVVPVVQSWVRIAQLASFGHAADSTAQRERCVANIRTLTERQAWFERVQRPHLDRQKVNRENAMKPRESTARVGLRNAVDKAYRKAVTKRGDSSLFQAVLSQLEARDDVRIHRKNKNITINGESRSFSRIANIISDLRKPH